jgi:hypothetical protein
MVVFLSVLNVCAMANLLAGNCSGLNLVETGLMNPLPPKNELYSSMAIKIGNLTAITREQQYDEHRATSKTQ